MLTTIREKTQGIIASFILVLIVIPFALWGINSYFEGGPGTYVAKVDGVEITQQAYRDAIEPLRGRVEPAMLESRTFKEMVLSGLIDQTLLVRDAEEAGFRIGDEQLARMIREVPLFQRDGRFDPEQYRALLRREGLSEQQFEQRLRGEHITRQAQAGFVESAIVTETEIDRVARLFAQSREFTQAVLTTEPFRARVTVTPQEVEQAYQAQADGFRTPEEVRVQYIRLAAADLVKNYQPKEEEIRKAYEEESARQGSPEKRRVSHILIEVPAAASEEEGRKVLARAEDLARRLKAGADFATLAKEHSQDPGSAAKGGDLGEIRPGMLPKPLESAALALRVGQVSAPVRSEFGYHLVKLTALTPAKRAPLAQMRNEIIKTLKARAGEERFAEQAEKFRNLVYENPESLEVAANTLELDIQQSGWFTRSGGSGVAANLKVVEAAFHPEVLSKSRTSDAIEVDAQTLVAVRVIDHKSSVRRPLAEVRAEIERELRDSAARVQAQLAAEELLKELRAGARLETLAGRQGLRLQAAKKVTRDQAGVDRRVLEAVFRADRPAEGKRSHELVDLGREGFALVALTAVNESGKPDAATRERARRVLSERRGAGYYNAYRAGLKQQAEIRIFDERL
jgi:peptidyl-prolyl cis-trans isomerase D